jgi:rhodanese-related sulfurtransferase
MDAMKSIFLVVCLSFGVAAPALAADAPLEISGAKTVNATQVVDLISTQSRLVIVDARHAEDYNAGAIEGAVRILDTEMTAEALAKVVPGKEAPVLFYCNGLKCGRAANAVKSAVNLGYRNVYYYALGMQDWKEKGLPLVTH